MRVLNNLGFILVVSLIGCGTPQLLTLTVYEDENRLVRLQTFPAGNNGKGFSHPAYLKTEDIARLMNGLSVEIKSSSIARSLLGGGTSEVHQAFSKKEIEFFAPLFVEGLRQATSEEVVTFYETVQISDLHELTTSGAIFIKNDVMHFVLSNYGVKTEVWQDAEQYKAPFRNQPLEIIDSVPGRLLFNPEALMVQPKQGLLLTVLKGKPWQVGIRFQELPQKF